MGKIKTNFVFNEDDIDDILCNYEWWVEDQEFGNCCGATILSGFPEVDFDDLVRDIYTEFDDQLHVFKQDYDPPYSIPRKPSKAKILELFEKRLIKVLPLFSSGHIWSCILNDTQSWMIPLFKKKGFRVVSDNVTNKGTGNKLFVLIYDKEVTLKKTKKSIWGKAARL